MRTGAKLLLVCLGVAIAGVLIGFYVSTLTTLEGSASYTFPVSKSTSGKPVVNITFETVAAVGPKLSPNPDWVSYLIRNTQGTWERRTVWDLPANATIHVTWFNFDGASGLRNKYFGRPEGIDGNRITVDGKTVDGIYPANASHTFAVPAFHLIVAAPGVGGAAKNQCGYGPCPLSDAHRTIKFTFQTPSTPGHYRWQCFVPCAAGWIDGWGGPMQTIGYMDGFLNVKA